MSSRAELVAALRSRLEFDSWPRCTMTVIVSLAGLAGFLTSVLLLRLGIDSMPRRYALSALTGYAAFLVLMRLWISSDGTSRSSGQAAS